MAAFVLPHNARPPISVETTDAPLGDPLARLLGDSPPAIHSDWDVYLIENSLIYVKKDPCSPQDAEPTFFLHLDPVDMNDLPRHRKQYGFDNLDFAFGNHRIPIKGEVCAAVRELPDYAIAAIRTGQFIGEGQKIWEGSFDIVEPADDGKRRTVNSAAPMGRWRALAARCLNPRGVTLPSRPRNALFVLFIAGILAYGAGFAWYMLARFDLINLIRDVSTDDAFYYFQIARNLAEGKFSTFDGGITRTNGYHPLWLFLITPFYWIFDKEAALFAIKAFEIMLVAGGVALVTAAARLACLPWVLMFAALPMLYQQRALLLGMEAAAALFMLSLFILTACLFARSPARWKWPLAAVAFACPGCAWSMSPYPWRQPPRCA